MSSKNLETKKINIAVYIPATLFLGLWAGGIIGSYFFFDVELSELCAHGYIILLLFPTCFLALSFEKTKISGGLILLALTAISFAISMGIFGGGGFSLAFPEGMVLTRYHRNVLICFFAALLFYAVTGRFSIAISGSTLLFFSYVMLRIMSESSLGKPLSWHVVWIALNELKGSLRSCGMSAMNSGQRYSLALTTISGFGGLALLLFGRRLRERRTETNNEAEKARRGRLLFRILCIIISLACIYSLMKFIH
mgnify:CR=1 FL=1